MDLLRAGTLFDVRDKACAGVPLRRRAIAQPLLA
jgi:hypothetical protein